MDTEIAIIGVAGRFPGANNPDRFWQNINNKINSILQFSDEELLLAGISQEILQNPNYVKAKGYLENAEYFDASFFKFSEHEAEILDPQYRLLFEVIWEALENAAYIPDNFTGRIGVFAGSSSIDTYYSKNLRQNTSSSLLTDNFTIALHNVKDFLANLIAYKLNLRGPAITIQTACSTSLVAVCMACQSLLTFESDIVLAGGTCVTVPLKSGYLFQEGMMMSPTGKCSAFSKEANGIVLGNGAGVVVLKRLNEALKDGDFIHAVIKGFSTNNDGGTRIGFTAPGVLGQQAVIEQALHKAGIKPEMISYIETHGTGTILGDLIEIEALKKVFNGCSHPISLGSAKPNIGHLDAAAGIANLIKAVQALKHRTLPPNINFNTPSPQINFSETPFQINTKSSCWESDIIRYAGVSSFGMGGTNAHVILTEAPKYENKREPLESVLLILSAQSPLTLQQLRKNLASFLRSNPDTNLSDLAYTLQVGRKHFKHRFACICKSIEDMVSHLQNPEYDISQDNLENLKKVALQWLTGTEIDWEKLTGLKKCRRIPLPTYVFSAKKYWVSAGMLKLPAFKSVDPNVTSESLEPDRNIEIIEKTIKEIFERFLNQKDVDVTQSFESLGGDSLVALLIAHEINKVLNLKLPFSIFSNNLSIQTLCKHISIHIENQC